MASTLRSRVNFPNFTFAGPESALNHGTELKDGGDPDFDGTGPRGGMGMGTGGQLRTQDLEKSSPEAAPSALVAIDESQSLQHSGSLSADDIGTGTGTGSIGSASTESAAGSVSGSGAPGGI